MNMTDPPEGLTRELVESISWDTSDEADSGDSISAMFDLHPEEEEMA